MKKRFIMILISALIISSFNFVLPESIVKANQLEGEIEAEKEDSSSALDNGNIEKDSKEKEDVSLHAADTEEREDAGDNEAPDWEQKEDEVIPDEVELLDPSAVEMTVPIYNYEIDNVVVPTAYAMSLNPYELPIEVGGGHVSTNQVVSRQYGIINKSSIDKIVKITFFVEDLNGDKITFVNSADEARNAEDDTYAVYLTLIPADEGEIKVEGNSVDKNTSASALSDVEMSGAEKQAIVLHPGENSIAFKLSKATYNFADGMPSLTGEKPEGDGEKVLEVTELCPDGKGVTAFTFGGVMNPNASWEKLLKGIKITAVYTYENAVGEEQIVEGTGAMIAVD